MDMASRRRKLIIQAVALVTVMQAFWVNKLRLARLSRPAITYGPMCDRDAERQANLNLIYNYSDVECISMLRMRRAPFFLLCNLFRNRNLLRDSVHTCIEEQVSMFLHVVGHNQIFRVIHHTFRRSIETVSRYFKEVLYAIGKLRDEMIRPPSNDTPIKISSSSRWYPYFKTPANDGVSNMTKKQPKDAASDSKGNKKRKRSLISDEETVMLSGTTEAVNNVAAAIRETAVHEVHPGLYGAVMNMTGYSENALFSSFAYLVDNKAQGAAFVTMNENHRIMWLNSF